MSCVSLGEENLLEPSVGPSSLREEGDSDMGDVNEALTGITAPEGRGSDILSPDEVDDQIPEQRKDSDIHKSAFHVGHLTGQPPSPTLSFDKTGQVISSSPEMFASELRWQMDD